ncbi:3',5'-bisphosphate nucleotidase [Hypoxylon sp. NC1633]|nr:3',5'-bisphosphate nucleotidase [Hypoxylon sp. NC1633]
MRAKEDKQAITTSYTFTKFKFLLVSSLLVVILAAFLSRALPRLASLSLHLHPSTRQQIFTSNPNMSAYAKELEVAQLAVQRAAILTKRVFHEKAKGTVSKDDKSPVTIGDFGAQALIISALKANFPDDQIVAEEEAAQLRQDPNLKQAIWDLVQGTQLSDPAAESLLGGAIKDEESMLTMIDYGNSKGGAKGRIWAIDPIDGTKGFLRGGQYAVCLALMVDGDVKVGVLGCPNLPVDDATPLTGSMASGQTDEGSGVIVSGVLGQGATSRPLTTGALAGEKSISMKTITDIAGATFCESVEAGHSSHGDQAEIAKLLGITNPSVRMDSQAKYASIARGAGEIYLRLPVSATYQEKIWDHAAGDLIVREAGGAVTDIHGNRLSFGVGRTLANNKGVVAAPAAGHAQVLKAVQDVLSKK